jgi:1,4-dihydroxy-6-naphthoate synthase
MADERPMLGLGHSPDPDDAFMWWPITGAALGAPAPPAISTGRFRYCAVPLDIETLNRRAAEQGDLDVTALSARAYADVADRYIITACGASFGDGYGPKVVARPASRVHRPEDLRGPGTRIAVPGARTTAFLALSLLLEGPFEFVEMPFDRILGAVAENMVDAGLIIHEGQLTFGDLGLVELVDLGRWWKRVTGLPLPLGVNAVRRDLDDRFGPGSVADAVRTLSASVDYALRHREEGLEYARRFAMGNIGGAAATPGRVHTFVDMYVNQWTLAMGDAGRRAIEMLLMRGAARRLCPPTAPIDLAAPTP